MSDFFKELQRRKVIRTATAYAVAAFVIMQIVEIVFPMFEIPNWAGRMVIILLSLGFPLVLIVAWIFDRTPEGKIEKDKQDQDLRPAAKKKRTWFAVGGITAGLIAGIIFARVYSSEGNSNPAFNEKSIAVLPFTSFSDEKEDSYFADGVHDDILTQLSKIKDIKVISRTSVMEYKNTTKKIKTIAKELNVKHILEGSVRRAGNQIRIVSQLINAVTDEHLWAETYDRNYADIFSIQSDVAQKIAAALKATLTPAEKGNIEENPTQNMEAYDYFLKGKYFWNTKTSQEGNQKAIDMFYKAIELDPDFALAYAWASVGHSVLYQNQAWDHTPARKKLAKNTLDRAIALDQDHSKVHFARGIYFDWCLDDNYAALKEFETAFKGEPSSSEIARHVGDIYINLGRMQKAEEYLLKAYELGPLDILNGFYLGHFYRRLRQFKKSNYYFDLAIQTNPEISIYYRSKAFNYIYSTGDVKKARILLKEAEMNISSPDDLLGVYFWIELFDRNYSKSVNIAKLLKTTNPSDLLARAYYYMGEKNLAREEYEYLQEYYLEKIKFEPGKASFHSELGKAYAFLGKNAEAIAEGKKGVELLPVNEDFRDGPGRVNDLASIYILTGQHELAIDQLEYLLSIPGSTTISILKLGPRYDPLRENPRFKELVSGN